jgi:uncharacterized protein (DUF58 family)
MAQAWTTYGSHRREVGMSKGRSKVEEILEKLREYHAKGGGSLQDVKEGLEEIREEVDILLDAVNVDINKL